ncbi:MAG: TonB-dependent receptor plug domain-containing protein [Pseudomonadota bacterium]
MGTQISSTRNSSLKAILIGSAAFVATTPGFAFAQTSDNDVVLDEIIVTSQKRSENLQDVPISITAVSGAQIQQARIGRLDELSTFVPNLQINQDVISDRISIRGVGSGEQAGFEQSVGTFVDGIYRGRGVQSRFAFLDVEAVEVLRGPQGTLFGKNTIAGALNITSAKPTDEFEGLFEANYDFTLESVTLNGFLSGPLSDTVRARVAFQTRDQEKGWVENGLSGDDYPDLEEYGIRGSLEWDVTPSTLLSLKYEYGEFDSNGAPFEHVVAGPFAPLGVEDRPDYSINSSNVDLITGQVDPVLDFGTLQLFEGHTEELSATLVHDFAAGGELTAIAAYSNYEYMRDIDADTAPIALLRFDDNEDFEQTSLEVRYASDTGGPLDYIVGAFYLNNDLIASGLTYANINTLFAQRRY